MLPLLCSVATAQVYQLTTDTFDVALQEGPLFVKFYAPWCARPFHRRNSASPGKNLTRNSALALRNSEAHAPLHRPRCGHCKRLSPAWDALGAKAEAGELGGTRVAKVDCTAHKDLQRKYGVRSYPTLLYLGSDGTMKKHMGGRDESSLADFARDGWQRANDYDPSYEPPRGGRKSVFRLLSESPALLAMLLLALAFVVGAVACCLMPGWDDDADERERWAAAAAKAEAAEKAAAAAAAKGEKAE